MLFRENVPLAQFSSYKIGGPARYFFEAVTKDELKEAFSSWRERSHRKDPFFVLGGGTNLLLSDLGFPGLVVQPRFENLEVDGDKIHAGAGVLVADLLNVAVAHELSGLEWAGGLPGTLGGAIRGNAGCFGGEIKDVVETVESFDTNTFAYLQRSAGECGFGYRRSIFKERPGAEVVVGATLKLARGDGEKIKKTIEERIRYRKERHPLEHPNIGSIFKNVPTAYVPETYLASIKNIVKTDPFPVVPTAYLIAEAGLKGVSYGGAMISPKHPNFIVNVLGARAEDVRALIGLVKDEIKERFSIKLEEEVEIV